MTLYDQWKTASPYDEDYDEEHCAKCGDPLDKDHQEGSPQFNGYCSLECESGDCDTYINGGGDINGE